MAMCVASALPQVATAFEFNADEWQISVQAGFGGTGIQKQVEKNGDTFDISRGETPGFFGIDFETFTSDRWRFTIGHRRGVRLGPFSSGVGFTGASWNYYPFSTPPKDIDFTEGNYLAGEGYSTFVGIATGVGYGTITRESDQVGSVTASGVYLGIRLGVDWAYAPGMIIRPEIIGSQTFYDAGNLPSSLNEFGIVCGFIFHLPPIFD
ncbi:MAG: hypothetical protein HRT45_08945 [Bdellovibrionales bacterium]|nr:hypothetical protein [Bdellovibrionales bacterium]